jgi:IrrE N-terminal-like domain
MLMSNLGMAAAPMKVAAIALIAKQFREALDIGTVDKVDMEELFEFRLPKRFKGIDIEILPDTDTILAGAHGISRPDLGYIGLASSVYEGMCTGKGRDKITGAHEFGHLVLHQSGRVMAMRTSKPPEAFRDPEWQANCFAGCFLAPPHMISVLDTAEQVADRFGLSIEAAKIQLRHAQKLKGFQK